MAREDNATDQDQRLHKKKIRNARNLANTAIARGKICTDKNEVLKKYPHYSEAEVQAYLDAIEEKKPSREDLVRNKARSCARVAANNGLRSTVTSREITTKFAFSPKEAELYVEEYHRVYKATINNSV